MDANQDSGGLMDSLADNFFRYFQPIYAASPAQKRSGYDIRYRVYVEELGWEAPNPARLETDPCDAYAHPCLLEHKRTGETAGCVRLVVPETVDGQAYLPFQRHEIAGIDTRHLALNQPTQVGEISRLAVPSLFRRRRNESGKPFILDESSAAEAYSQEELRNFPNIAIGLYLSAIALVDLCDLQLALVVMEPRLQRHLQRFGLHFQCISDPFELRGQRALFELPREQLTTHMSSDIRALYERIRESLYRQPWQASAEHNPRVDQHGSI
ncbi:MAG: PEP-CTERM/exosortase system-associated acyltransferase [Candidatus Thiodiazotropha sp.]